MTKHQSKLRQYLGIRRHFIIPFLVKQIFDSYICKKNSMKRLVTITCSIILLCAANVNGQSKKETIENPSLAKEIVKMRDQDQKLRNKWVKMIRNGKDSGKKYKETTDLLLDTDENNTARMRQIVAQYGWPTKSMVGRRASNSAWLLVQHADRDPLFQVECLPLLKAAVDNDEANPRNYAYLYDRVAAAKGEKQLYATQSSSNNGLVKGTFYPIQDESNVQIRRAEMGIDQHVEEYAKSMGFEYSVPTALEADKRKMQLIEFYESNLSIAQSAEEEKDFDKAIEYYKKATSAYGIAQVEDFYNYGRLLSSTNNKDKGYAAYSLIKAVLKGYPNPDSIDNNPEFLNAKKESPRNWKMLMNTIDQLK